METYTSTKVNVSYKYIKTPLIRFFLKYILINLFAMNFFKILESRIIFRYLNPKNNEKICDVACGCGEYSIKLSKKGCNVTGIDMNQKSIKIAKILSENGKFVISTAEKLPLKSKVFDKVVSVCALEHFKDDAAAIHEMYRILKSDGYLVLTVDSFTSKISKDILDAHRAKNYVVNYYSLSQLKNKLEKCGFEIEDAKYFVNSPLSVLFFRLSVKNVWITMITFPFVLAITIISDLLKGKNDGGIFLAVKAKKVCQE